MAAGMSGMSGGTIAAGVTGRIVSAGMSGGTIAAGVTGRIVSAAIPGTMGPTAALADLSVVPTTLQ